MPARQVKSLNNNHREHRSKKKRRYNPEHSEIVLFRRKKEKIKIKELEQEKNAFI